MSVPNRELEISLLDRVKKSDSIAFRKIFDIHYKYLTLIAFRYLNDREKAKDMAQDAFVELWNRRENLVIKSGLKAYLRQTVINKCLNFIKREKRINFSEPALLPERPVEAIAQRKIEAEDTQQIIQEAINSLPERCRIIFSMSRFDEMSHKEIAEKLDIKTKTIENQITRALKIIRSALAQQTLPILYLITFFSMMLRG